MPGQPDGRVGDASLLEVHELGRLAALYSQNPGGRGLLKELAASLEDVEPVLVVPRHGRRERQLPDDLLDLEAARQLHHWEPVALRRDGCSERDRCSQRRYQSCA